MSTPQDGATDFDLLGLFMADWHAFGHRQSVLVMQVEKLDCIARTAEDFPPYSYFSRSSCKGLGCHWEIFCCCSLPVGGPREPSPSPPREQQQQQQQTLHVFMKGGCHTKYGCQAALLASPKPASKPGLGVTTRWHTSSLRARNRPAEQRLVRSIAAPDYALRV